MPLLLELASRSEAVLQTVLADALAKKRRLAEEDLAGEKVLLLDEGHCLRGQVLSLCLEAHAHESPQDFRATSLETRRHMVAAGMGTMLLPVLALHKGEGELVALPSEQPGPGGASRQRGARRTRARPTFRSSHSSSGRTCRRA